MQKKQMVYSSKTTINSGYKWIKTVRMRIWGEQRECVNPSCLLAKVQDDGGLMVVECFLVIYLDTLFKFRSLPRNCVQLQQDNGACHKSNIWRVAWWSYEISAFKCSPRSPELNSMQCLWDLVGMKISVLSVQLRKIKELLNVIIKNVFFQLVDS